MATYNFDFFQIPHTGVDSTTKGIAAQTRDADMKISNFGALNVGLRMSTDYTRTVLDYKFKDESADWNVLREDTSKGSNVAGRAVTIDHNPLLVGSTVKYTRDDQFVRTDMYTSAGAEVKKPAYDVMDEKQSTAAGIVNDSDAIIKNWPSEGWRSFGGKYDFYTPYAGGVLK
jgi:hypothetical protein